MSIRRSKRIAVLVAVAALAGSTVVLGIARALKTGV
jgi:hypothetical protein